jgi:hypothetical protein
MACGYASWIPGLALLARNDVPSVTLPNTVDDQTTFFANVASFSQVFRLYE